MNQDKGLTILEAIASVAVLSILILVIVAVLQNSSATSSSTNVTDRALQNARTVMEEIKNRLDTSESAFTYLNQTINLASLRDRTVASTQQTVYFPNVSNKQYSIAIQSMTPNLLVDPIAGQSNKYNLNDVFRKITVTVTELKSSRRPVKLESMVAF